MRFALVVVSCLLLLFAGCAGPESDASNSPSPQPEPPLPPRQVLSLEASSCPETFKGPLMKEFTVDADYERLVIEFHQSGVGQIELKILDPEGHVAYDGDPLVVSNQPCTHAHEGNPLTLNATRAGTWSAVLEGEGVFGYHLLIVESGHKSDATGAHHTTAA